MLLSKGIAARAIALGLISGSAACMRLQEAPEAWACSTDDDCESGQACFRSQASGKQTCRSPGYCEVDAECSDLQVCRGQLCTGVECKEGDAEACSPFACRVNDCLTECQSWDDCVAGHACDQGSCVPSECMPLSGANDCDGFACVEGLCLETCDDATDCASGFNCKDGSCAPDPKPDGSSCEVNAGCRSGLCCPTDAVDTYQCAASCQRRGVGESCGWGAICQSLSCEGGVCVACQDDECRDILCGSRECGTLEDVNCGSCEGETYCGEGGNCQPWAECPPGTEPISTPSSTADRDCSKCVGGYSTTPNSTCEAWSECAGIEDVPPSTTQDRACYEGWNRTYGTQGRIQAANGLTLITGGDAIVGGFRAPEIDDPLSIYAYAYVRRISSVDGEILWEQLTGTMTWNTTWSVAADSSGNVYAAGYHSTTGAPLWDEDVFVQKLSVADGTPIWTRHFGTDDNDEANSVSVAPDGNVLVTGYTYGALAGVASPGDVHDVFALKLSSADGSVIWQTQFGPGNGYGVAVDSAGDVFVVGDVDVDVAGPEGEGSFTVRKLSGATGAEIWTRRMGHQDADFARAVAVDGSNDVFVGGDYDGASAVMKLDGGDGTRLWLAELTPGLGTRPDRLVVTQSGTVLIAGTTETNLDLEGALGGGYVLELSADDGTLEWVEQFGVRYQESPRDVAMDGSGEIWIAGSRDVSPNGDGTQQSSFVAKIIRD